MAKVTECILTLQTLFEALPSQNQEEVVAIALKISKLEHKADIAKNDIRDHLPSSLFLPVDRTHLLNVLALQDDLADSAEDVAVLLSMKPLEALPAIQTHFELFLAKNFETFDGARLIIEELDELLETSFGGIEAERVRKMVDDVAYKEHETDLLQRELLKALFATGNLLSVASFFQWMKVIETLASLSNISENLAYQIRAMLEVKT